MWKEMLYNIFIGQKSEMQNESKEVIDQKEQRLEELRKKQGRDVEYYKEELMRDINVD